MAENTQTQQVQQSPTVMDLIKTETLSQHAAVLGIMAYEQEHASYGKFPLTFYPELGRAYRFAPVSEAVNHNCLVISRISQYTSIGLSVLVHYVDLANGLTSFEVFRQATYCNPTHQWVDIDQFPAEKEAITNLLFGIAMQDNSDLKKAMFNVYYLAEAGIEKFNSCTDPDKVIVIDDIPSNVEVPDLERNDIAEELLDIPPVGQVDLNQL